MIRSARASNPAADSSPSTIFEHRLYPYDHGMDNLLWDAASKKWYVCSTEQAVLRLMRYGSYFIGLEMCEDWNDNCFPLQFDDQFFEYWDLLRMNHRVEEW